MTKAIRYSLLSLRDLLVSGGPFVLLTLVLLGLAYWWLDPTPPKQVTLATGPAQSAYAEFGKRYAAELARHGIEVELITTEGSSQNLAMLRDGSVDLAFVKGGSNELAIDHENELESLGSLFLEPVWLFYREPVARKVSARGVLSSLADLRGLRVNVGAEGSGIPGLMDKLFEANRIDTQGLKLSRLGQTESTVAFLNGELDALVFASAPESLMVQMLLQTPGVKLMNFAQNEAYARRFSFLSPVTLPQGVVDLSANVPVQDVRLIATTATLLAREDVHPALMQLFSQASLKLHDKAGWFNRAHEYPNLANNEFPLAKEAERTVRQGVPLLQRYLPFLVANLLERMWLALGIIVAILLPLSRIVPPLYEFRIRSRVFRWYGQLREIEDRIESEPPEPSQDLLDALNRLESRVEKVTVPLSYADELYSLRNHIEMVRQKIKRT